ncbi:MAG: hypothetical protein QOG10_2755 [Kribbellaceae bacterium]|nr:hypothetical protein [Kribbellaceae bacterium]
MCHTTTFSGTTYVDEYTVADVRFAETANQCAAEVTRAYVEIAPLTPEEGRPARRATPRPGTWEPGEEDIEPGAVYIQVRLQGYILGRNGRRDARQATSQRLFGDCESEERYEFVRELALESLRRHNIDRHKAFGMRVETWTLFDAGRRS